MYIKISIGNLTAIFHLSQKKSVEIAEGRTKLVSDEDQSVVIFSICNPLGIKHCLKMQLGSYQQIQVYFD